METKFQSKIVCTTKSTKTIVQFPSTIPLSTELQEWKPNLGNKHYKYALQVEHQNQMRRHKKNKRLYSKNLFRLRGKMKKQVQFLLTNNTRFTWFNAQVHFCWVSYFVIRITSRKVVVCGWDGWQCERRGEEHNDHFILTYSLLPWRCVTIYICVSDLAFDIFSETCWLALGLGYQHRTATESSHALCYCIRFGRYTFAVDTSQ